MNATVMLTPTVVGRMGNLEGAADFSNRLVIGNELISRFELADDLLRCVAVSFQGGVPAPLWPDWDSHLPWTNLLGQRQA
jgi:hypothetical protein